METLKRSGIKRECLVRLREMRIKRTEEFSVCKCVFFSGGQQDPYPPRRYPDLAAIKAVDENFGVTTYFVVRSKTPRGTEDAFLFVSHEPDSWPHELRALRFGEPMAWVVNHEHPERNGFRRVGVAPTRHGGLWRFY